MDEISRIVKSGETTIQTTLMRSNDGLTVNIWAHPRVEDFIRSLGSGEHVDIQTLGRHWIPPSKLKDSPKMYVYNLQQDLGILPIDASLSYRLDRPGYPLLDDGRGDGDGPPPGGGGLFKSSKGGYPEILNLSFLRYVGVSNSGGVTFSIKSVSTLEGGDRLAEKIKLASGRFYREFLKPFKLIVSVSVMPLG